MRGPPTPLAAILALQVACAAGSDAPIFVLRDSSGITIAESAAPLWGDSTAWALDSVASLSIGIEDGDPRYTLSNVGWPRRLTDGRIIVPNTTNGIVNVYSADGEYLTAFGGRGGGPGEFEYIRYLWADPGGTIHVYDDDRGTLTAFSPEGDLLHTERIESTGSYYGLFLGWFADGSFGLTKNVGGGSIVPGARERRDSLAYEWHNPDGSLLRVHGVGLANRRFRASDGQSFIDPFSPRFAVATFQDVVAVGSGEFPEIHLLGNTGDTVRIIRWQAPEPQLTTGEFRRFGTDMIDSAFQGRWAFERPRYRRFFSEGLVEQRYPYYVAFLWDELGCLWVRRYDWVKDNNWTGRRWNTGPGEWWVFANDGQWLGSVHVPDAVDPAQIGSDFVVAIHRDELDVQRVRVYGLRR